MIKDRVAILSHNMFTSLGSIILPANEVDARIKRIDASFCTVNFTSKIHIFMKAKPKRKSALNKIQVFTILFIVTPVSRLPFL